MIQHITSRWRFVFGGFVAEGFVAKTPPSVTNLYPEMAAQAYKPYVADLLPYIYI